MHHNHLTNNSLSYKNKTIRRAFHIDWTLDSDGKMNVMVEQTTYVESKPSSSSKKQRRRRGKFENRYDYILVFSSPLAIPIMC